jgi:hypothetical protein
MWPGGTFDMRLPCVDRHHDLDSSIFGVFMMFNGAKTINILPTTVR